MNAVLAILASYAIGGIPFAVVAAKLKGVDLARHGSGNPGATNAMRVLGPALGIPVLLLDVAKGFAAAWVGGRFAGGGEGMSLACGAAAIAGHVWPIALRFRGGKGVATTAGVFLALAPAATGIAAGLFVVVLFAFRYVSAASIAASVALPAALAGLGASRIVLGVAGVVAALVVVRHRANLARLAAGTEHRIRLGGRRGSVS